MIDYILSQKKCTYSHFKYSMIMQVNTIYLINSSSMSIVCEIVLNIYIDY